MVGRMLLPLPVRTMMTRSDSCPSERIKAAPFQQRLLNALARYGVGIGLVQRFSRIGINPTRTVLACTKYAGTRGLFLSLASAGVTSSVASVKKAEKRET